MPVSKAQQKATNKYISKAYDRVNLTLPKGQKDEIQAHAAAQGESVIRGTSRLEHKECNRADAIREEYAKAGIEVDTSQEDIMRIRGGRIRQARVQSHGDHRMAMSMAVAGLLCDGEMTIEGAECVAKSYPGFFEDLEKIRI